MHNPPGFCRSLCGSLHAGFCQTSHTPLGCGGFNRFAHSAGPYRLGQSFLVFGGKVTLHMFVSKFSVGRSPYTFWLEGHLTHFCFPVFGEKVTLHIFVSQFSVGRSPYTFLFPSFWWEGHLTHFCFSVFGGKVTLHIFVSQFSVGRSPHTFWIPSFRWEDHLTHFCFTVFG